MTEMREVTLNGRWPMILPEHRAARPQWTEPPYWEKARLDSMHANIRPRDVVYDIGAEEGDMTALYASWGATVIPFEPNPLVWPNIRAVFEANKLPTPVASWVGFAGDTTRRVGEYNSLVLAPDWPACAHGPVIGDHGFAQLNERPDISAIALDDLIGVVRTPDVITMDVEGSEYEVLLGAQELLKFCHPLVYISIHDSFMREQYNRSRESVMGLMHSLGYWTRWLATDHEEHWVFYHPNNSRGFVA